MENLVIRRLYSSFGGRELNLNSFQVRFLLLVKSNLIPSMVAIISMERDGFSKLRVECGELRINNYQFTKKKLRKRKTPSASFHSVLHLMREDSVSTFLNVRGIGFIALVCWSFSLDVVFEKGIHQSVLFLFFGMKKFYLLLIGCVFLM